MYDSQNFMELRLKISELLRNNIPAGPDIGLCASEQTACDTLARCPRNNLDGFSCRFVHRYRRVRNPYRSYASYPDRQECV